MADTFASFARKMDVFARELSPQAVKAIAREVAKEAEPDALKAAKADHSGRDFFSGAPNMKFTTVVKSMGASSAVVKPGRGWAWPVGEKGRHPGMSQAPGPKVLKSGKLSRAKRKKWNGTTAPQHTWSEGAVVIERETPKRVNRAVLKAMRKAGV